MPGIFIYQIEYSKSVKLDPGFLVLDNLANERPDWFEYWPIRRFLIGAALDDDSFYGFLSPRFKAKTNLSAQAARDFVARESAQADAVVLSPGLKLGAYFQNVFTFGEWAHPGLLDVTKQFIRRIDPNADLDTWVTTSRNEVYCNYLIAKPRFWRAWLAVTEQLFAIAESPTDRLGAELRATTLYRDGQNPHMKIFRLFRFEWLNECVTGASRQQRPRPGATPLQPVAMGRHSARQHRRQRKPFAGNSNGGIQQPRQRQAPPSENRPTLAIPRKARANDSTPSPPDRGCKPPSPADTTRAGHRHTLRFPPAN